MSKEQKNKDAEVTVLAGVTIVAIGVAIALAVLAMLAFCHDWRGFWPNAGQPFATILGGLAVLGGGTLALYNGRKARDQERGLADEENARAIDLADKENTRIRDLADKENTRIRDLADKENTRIRELADAEHERQTKVADTQQAHETAKELNARFTTAATQLGNKDSIAIRQAGAHALAALADDWTRQGDLHQRQVCIDVLCGYLAVHEPVGHQPNTFIAPRRSSPVTKTIQQIVAQHTRMAWRPNSAAEPAHEHDWCDATFNFEHAHFEDLDLRNCLFTGNVNFTNAEFHGENALFVNTRFTGTLTSFKEAKFNTKKTFFSHVTFSATQTEFGGTEFKSTDLTDFSAATFEDTHLSFQKSVFASKETSFNGATFDAESYIFFSESTFSRTLIFSNADIKRGLVSFVNVAFDVERADFSQLTLHEGAKINFTDPKTWTPAKMTFDWNGYEPEDMPAGVRPRDWPPQVRA